MVSRDPLCSRARAAVFGCRRFWPWVACVLALGLVPDLPLLVSPALAQGTCEVPDNGSGTIFLPPEGCQYLSPDQVHMIIDGLPPGTTIELAPIHKDFICKEQAGAPGGTPAKECAVIDDGDPRNGETEQFSSTLEFSMQGTGALAGFSKVVSIPNVSCLVQSRPRTPGAPVQSFDTEMMQLQGQLPAGDPDFDFLRITGGSSFQLPGPGHTTLTRLPGGNWAVDSFFDITYRIDFVGAPGSRLGGRSGSTTGTIRMQAGGGGGDPTSCYPPAGKDIMDSSLLHDIDIPGIGLCRANLRGTVTVARSNPYVDAATGLQCIDTLITELNLQGADPVCGRICITLNPFKRSTGRICEKVPGSCFPANSFFDVFIKVELKDLGMCLYSCVPAHMECMIEQIPPFGCLYNLNVGTGGVVPLYQGDCTAAGADPCALQPLPPPAAYVVKAVHQPQPPPACDCFPGAGEDVLVTTLAHHIEIPGFNISCSSFMGPITVRRSAPYLDDSGACCIKTEIVHMEMKGTCSNGVPAVIRLCPTRRSTGFICAKQRGACFPAQSCFDIFFEIEVQMPTGPMTFKNCRPATMCCMINRLPPLGCDYALQNGPIELYKVPAGAGSPCFASPLPTPDGFLREATHTPNEPAEPCCPEYGPGRDVMKSQLLHNIVIPGLDKVCEANLSGPVVVERGTPYRDPLTGLCCVDTRMVDLNLQGVDPVCGRICIKLDPRRPSKGRICQMPGMTTCFPAESCFDVFVRIELKDMGMVLVACEPARMCCKIAGIPPFECQYQLDIGQGNMVPLYEEPTHTVVGGGGGVPNNCTVADNGSGTVDLPPAGCEYLSPDQVHMIIDGLPAGTTIELAPIHKNFLCERLGDCGQPGGALGGEHEIFQSTLEFQLQGTDTLATFNRMVTIPNVFCETHTGPRTPGMPTQDFPTDMSRLQGQLPAGDPDFDFLRITAGTAFQMPSPGHTTLNQLPGGNWAVDSFFDITYRIDFVGAPNGRLAGRSGSTTGTIRMQTGGGGGGTPGDPCAETPLPRPVAFIDKAVHQPTPPCDCFPPAGTDTMKSELSHRIRLYGLGPNGGDLVCDADMSGPVVVQRSDPYIDPATGVCCIDTEIVRMRLEGNDPVCGPIIITPCPDMPSKGKICQMPGMDGCFPAASFFDIFVQIEVPNLGLVLKNCAPARVECKIDRIPPINCVYQLNLSAVNLFKDGQCALLPDPAIRPTGVIEAARHVPREPCECAYGPGVDVMDSTLSHDIVIFGLPQVCRAPLRGIVKIERGEPYKTADGLCCVSTRMLELDLTGVDSACGDVRIRLCPERASRGTICQMMPGACFPAESCFEVFIEVEVMGMVLKNCAPAKMCCKINGIPPYDCTYQIDLGSNVLLFKKGDCGTPDASPLGQIRQATHTPKPCGPTAINCAVNADGTISVNVADDPDCPCESLTITRSIDGGPPEPVTLAAIAAGAPVPGSGVDRPCAGLPPGPHTITYCAQCTTAGSTSVQVCCSVTVDCPPTTCRDCIGQADCAVTGNGQVVVRWTYIDPGCRCDKVEIWYVDPAGAQVMVATVAGSDVPSFTTDCRPGRFCVRCICADGTPGQFHCCGIDATQCGPKVIFKRGDSNSSGRVDISDGINTLGALFTGQGRIPCPDAADAGDQGLVNISSAVFTFSFLFQGGGNPPFPGPFVCDMDMTDDSLSPCDYPASVCQ